MGVIQVGAGDPLVAWRVRWPSFPETPCIFILAGLVRTESVAQTVSAAELVEVMPGEESVPDPGVRLEDKDLREEVEEVEEVLMFANFPGEFPRMLPKPGVQVVAVELATRPPIRRASAATPRPLIH